MQPDKKDSPDISPVIILPHPALQPYIYHYVFTLVGVAGQWSAFPMVPPGCGVLSVTMGGLEVQLKIDDAESIRLEAVSFAGQTTHFSTVGINDQYPTLFVIFKPCGAYHLLGVSQHNCVDIMVSLSDLVGKKAHALQHQLEAGPTIAGTRKAIETFLLQRLQERNKADIIHYYGHISEKIRGSSHESLLIRKICQEEGVSKSTLDRKMKEIVGIGPKHFQRIVRFNTMLQYVNQQRPRRNWTEIAYQFGYYDQAHFIKEFKLFYGKTPSDYSAGDKILTRLAH